MGIQNQGANNRNYRRTYNNQWVIKATPEKTGSALIENKDRAYWETLTIPKLKEQIMFRGQRYTGAKVKKDYLEIMYKILQI